MSLTSFEGNGVTRIVQRITHFCQKDVCHQVNNQVWLARADGWHEERKEV